MNDDSNRSQLNSLKSELERVELDLRFLRVKADELEARITAEERASLQSAILNRFTAPPAVSPAPVPPIVDAPKPEPQPELAPAFVQPTPPAAPPIIAPASQPVFLKEADPFPSILTEPPLAPPPIPAKPESFEMRLGTYWFVRIGIVMVLTAMVFLGNYAYQHYVGLLGPLGKLILLYLGSGALLAAGTILPRRQERLKNYGQVLFAGGLAAVYFTTYAAHHFPNLRVITSPVLDGILLLAWTSFIVWLADRKKSEVLAVFAIGLAYYTALITNVGSFTLISNLFLAAAAVFFLIRNRWVTLTFLSIGASYGSYFYWHYYAASPDIQEFAGRLSICGYWIVFTTAVFYSRHIEFAGPRRAGFLTFNNAAAFLLLTFSFLHEQSGRFWQLALAAGIVLLALSYLATRFIADDELPRRAYLAQGLLLTTLGIISKLSGPTLALVLAVESSLLIIFATQWKLRLLSIAGVIVGGLSAAWLLFNIHPTDPGAWAKSAGVAALLLFNAFWTTKHETEPDHPDIVRPLPAYFGALACVTWCAAVFFLGKPLQIAPILATTAIALTGLHYLLRAREVTLLAQSLLAVAQGQLLVLLAGEKVGPSFTPYFVVAISLAMAIWWRHQKQINFDSTGQRFLEIVYAAAVAGITQFYLGQAIQSEWVVTAAWLLTLAWIALGFATRVWSIAATGQIFVLFAGLQRLGLMLTARPQTAGHSIEIIIAIIALAYIAHRLVATRPALKPIAILPFIYQWFAAALTFFAVHRYVDAEQYQFVVLVALFGASFAATMLGARYTFWPGVALAAGGAWLWIASERVDAVGLQNLFAILMIATMQFLARRKPEPFPLTDPAHQVWIAINSGALWLFVSWWVIVHSAGAHFYLTASWAILAFALFGLGFALRERTYRWAALTVLTCSLGRVVMLDVWKLETVYRIFSFLALGIVLLVLGYFYTRFQEKIAKWL